MAVTVGPPAQYEYYFAQTLRGGTGYGVRTPVKVWNVSEPFAEAPSPGSSNPTYPGTPGSFPWFWESIPIIPSTSRAKHVGMVAVHRAVR